MDSKNDNIEPYKNVLIINLQNRPDRLLNVYKQLDSIGLADSTIRIKAVDKQEAMNHTNILSTEACINIIDVKNTCIIPNFSALGCALSHMKCWKYIVDNNLDDGLIVEDDIKITDSQLFRLDLTKVRNHIIYNKNISTIDRPYFIVFNPLFDKDRKINLNNYGYWFSSSSYNEYTDYKDDNKYNKAYKLCQPFTGTYLYYINYYMAKFLLNNMVSITYQIDLEIGKIANREPWNEIFFGYNTKNITTGDMGTDIQTYLIDNKYLANIMRDEHNIPEDLTNIIYTYLPTIFTRKR
jgi:GR25 family glycosyltransferase involved in LPS biosynthesis